jgi:hypothetical protein
MVCGQEMHESIGLSDWLINETRKKQNSENCNVNNDENCNVNNQRTNQHTNKKKAMLPSRFHYV